MSEQPKQPAAVVVGSVVPEQQECGSGHVTMGGSAPLMGMRAAEFDIKRLQNYVRELHAESKGHRERCAKLERGLIEALRLNKHYAQLLNEYDGGARMGFDRIEDWLERVFEES
jgi:hypothetical protein